MQGTKKTEGISGIEPVQTALSPEFEFAQRLEQLRPNLRRELVFGFVCPIGADRERALDLFASGLEEAGYNSQIVRVSAMLEEYADPKDLLDPLRRKEALMNIGDSMREQWYSGDRDHRLKGDAVALRSLIEIRKKRDSLMDELEIRMGTVDNVAYIIDSLKHPDELETLRTVYGPMFYAIGLYSPKQRRLKDLMTNAEAEGEGDFADLLIERDLHATSDFGQHVEDAFHECDFILKATEDDDAVSHDVKRFVRMVFGDPQYTPTKEEVGMFLATALQARSGSLARQVGSAILRDDGSVVSVGTNEVARAISGGQWWTDYGPYGSDLNYARRDTSDRYREAAVIDLLELLSKLDPKFESRIKVDPTLLKDKGALKKLVIEKDAPLKKALIRDSIDRIRAVHAEAAAIIDAARSGTSTKKTTMYVTTFPCHECARHIVAAGIREVIYLAPYPKSAVREMYRDSIKIDSEKRGKRKVNFRSFVGVTPRRYLQFFSVGKRKRKGDDGTPTRLNLKDRSPYLPGNPAPPFLVMLNESRVLAKFVPFLMREFTYPQGDAPGTGAN
jgi:cytidine deaminase